MKSIHSQLANASSLQVMARSFGCESTHPLDPAAELGGKASPVKGLKVSFRTSNRPGGHRRNKRRVWNRLGRVSVIAALLASCQLTMETGAAFGATSCTSSGHCYTMVRLG